MDLSAERTKFTAAFAALAVGIIYLGVKFISHYGSFAIDFDYIWWSGKIWLGGQNPYTAAFSEIASSSDLFRGTKPPELFGYPFNWALPAMALAKLPLETATFIWRAAGIISLVPSAILIFFASRPLTPSPQFSDVLFVLAYLFLMQATAISLANGQTAWVILLGLSLILYGIAFENTLLTAFGLTCVMLKPQIGIPIFATLIVTRRQWPASVIAGIFSALLSLPAIVINGLSETFFTFLETIPHYALHAVNAPSSMTGIQNLIWQIIKLNINSVALLLIATIAAIVIAIKLRQIIGHEKQAVMRALFVTLAIILAVVPLHTYDFIIAAPFAFLFLGYHHNARWLLLVAVAIIFRSDNIGKWTGFHSDSTIYFFGSTLNSIASIFFLIGIIWLAFDRRMGREKSLSSRPKESLLQ